MNDRVRASLIGAAFVIASLVITHLPTGARADGPVCLWHLKDGPTDVYLLGSIHALKPDLYPLPAVVEQAYAASDTVVFEVDFRHTGPKDMADIVRRFGHYRDGMTIDADLTPETMAMLRGYVDHEGLDIAAFEPMKPWLVSVAISQRELARHGYIADLGIDQHFFKRALDDGKTIVAVESFGEQIAMLAADPPAVQDLSLRAVLAEVSRVDDHLGALVAAWQQGNADRMLAIALEPSNRYPRLASQVNRLIDRRNEQMATSIRSMIAEGGNYLVIIGALHMGGEGGIIRRLQNDYNVRQISR